MNNYRILIYYYTGDKLRKFTEEYEAWTIEEAIHQCKSENHYEFTFQKAQIIAIWQETETSWRERDWD